MKMKDARGPNVAAALSAHPETRGLSRKARAARVGVDASTLSRWENGLSIPRPEHIDKTARIVGCSPSDFTKPRDQILKIISAKSLPDWQAVNALFRFRMTERWRDGWPDTFLQLAGSHLLYVRLPQESGPDLFSSSLLTVSEIDSERGILFEIVNIDDRNKNETGEEIIYQYSGFLFPIAECIFLIGEEISGGNRL